VLREADAASAGDAALDTSSTPSVAAPAALACLTARRCAPASDAFALG